MVTVASKDNNRVVTQDVSVLSAFMFPALGFWIMEILYPDEGCLEAPALTVDASKSFLKTASLDETLLEIC